MSRKLSKAGVAEYLLIALAIAAVYLPLFLLPGPARPPRDGAPSPSRRGPALMGAESLPSEVRAALTARRSRGAA